VIGTDRWRSEPPCVYPPAKVGHMAKRRVGVEYSPSMLAPVRPGAASPDRRHATGVTRECAVLTDLLSLCDCH
jgi:hypothetical protein